MRVLLLTPYAPDATHHHAAADTIVPLAARLAREVELVVYAPGRAADHPRWTDRPGVRPGWLRRAWPRAATIEAAALARRARPDVVHAEYLQSAEVLWHCAGNGVLGLHDITEQVMWASYRASPPAQKPYRLAEALRTRWFERAAIRRAAAVLTLSEPDLAVVSARHRHAFLARPGVELGAQAWTPPPDPARPRLVFTGAMWRRANALAARYLAREVMPLVWREYPQAQLRVVGAEPTPDVRALAAADRRIVVTGTVADPRQELLDAHAVLAPSIVGGGVLMKVVHAMAAGAPVVTMPGPAAAADADTTMLFVGATAGELAAAAGDAVARPAEALARGERARAHVGRAFRWDDTVRTVLAAYAMASRR
jgi:glycosyltransferase involved in cell wall biosynthesis